MKLEIINGFPLAHSAVHDLDAPVAKRNWLYWGTFTECAHYVAEHSPAGLTAKAIDALNFESGPVHMGEPVLHNVGLVDKPIDPECKTLVGKLFDMNEGRRVGGKLHEHMIQSMDFNSIEERAQQDFNMACYKEARRYGTVASTVDWDCPDDRFGLPAGAHRLRSIDYNGKRYTFKLYNGDVVRIWEEVLPNG